MTEQEEQELERILSEASPTHVRWVMERLAVNSDAKAARALGLKRQAVYKWANKADLDRAVELLLRDALRAATLVLTESTVDAVLALKRALGDKAHRVPAANSILDRAGLPVTKRQEHSGSVDITLEWPE